MLVLDCRAFGGQAGASARIENYLGFPTGISGMASDGDGPTIRRRSSVSRSRYRTGQIVWAMGGGLRRARDAIC